jgi:hypothetical protein
MGHLGHIGHLGHLGIWGIWGIWGICLLTWKLPRSCPDYVIPAEAAEKLPAIT